MPSGGVGGRQAELFLDLVRAKNILKNMKRLFVTFSLVAIALSLGGIAQAEENLFEALPAGVDAYIYGYPLVTMEMTRRVMSNIEKPEGSRAPMGQFVRMRAIRLRHIAT